MQDKKENIINSAIKTINYEIDGLKSILEVLDDNYFRAIEIILACKGRVILSGMGKSGHIANKIAATLASTGTPSFFIHPGEASHGDLGMITKRDVVILLSNSGETKELRDIIFYCKRFEIPIIAIVRRSQSELVNSANVSLVLSKAPEATKINAPTTSTTMMLALGDAIAVSLIDAKSFDTENFGVFHPGGKLGAAFVRVKDIMRKDNELPLVNQNVKMPEILLEMTSKRLGCAGVISDARKLIGIVTDGDLRRHMADNFMDKSAQDVMTASPFEISEDILAVEAVALMNKNSITSLFVVKNDQIIGAVHLHDCLRIGAA